MNVENLKQIEKEASELLKDAERDGDTFSINIAKAMLHKTKELLKEQN